jgi:hypothetical protein
VRPVPLLLFAVLPLAPACGADDCETLCSRAAGRVALCLEDWSAAWQDLGADSQRDWRVRCEDDWSATRADLEPREVQLAVDACSDTLSALTEMSCDELRALYLDAR